MTARDEHSVRPGEGFLALGLVLALRGGPALAGLGLTLLSFKPQVGLLAILFVLARRRDWKLLAVPGLVYALSLLYWGWWVPDWFASLGTLGQLAQGGTTNLSLWPYSLPLLAVLLWQRHSLSAWLSVESLVMPYFAVYSLAVLFCLWVPLWANVLLWAIYLTAVLNSAVVQAVTLVPLGLLLATIATSRQRAQPSLLLGARA